MARRGENIYLRKDGRYEGRYIKGRREDGKAVFGSIYGKRYSEVKRKLARVKAQVYGPKGGLEQYAKCTLSEWTEYYLQVLVRPRVKPGTYDNYRRCMEKHILPWIGGIKMKELTPQDIEGTAAKLRDHLAAATLRGVFRILRSMLAEAVERGALDKTPYRGIRLPKGSTKPPRVLTTAEQSKLEQAIRGTGDMEYLLCLYTGLRVGEVCALRWEDVDFENGLIHVQRTAQRTGGGKEPTALTVGTPKSESSRREIPLPMFLADMLKELAGGVTQGYIFEGRDGGMRDVRTFQKKLKRICDGLGLKDVHMHTLRHSFSTRCLEHGVGVEVLSALLGHSSPQITLKYYAHCTLEAKRRSMALLGGEA